MQLSLVGSRSAEPAACLKQPQLLRAHGKLNPVLQPDLFPFKHVERGSLLFRSAEQTLHRVQPAPWRIRRPPCGSLQASSPNNFGPGSCRTFCLSGFLVYLCLPSLQACGSWLSLSCPRTCAAACLPPFLSDLQLQLLIHVWFLSEKNIHLECLTHCLRSISAAPQRFSEYPSLQRTACSECDPQQTARQQPPLPRTRVCHMSCSVLTVTVPPLPFPRHARWTGMPCAGCQWDLLQLSMKGLSVSASRLLQQVVNWQKINSRRILTALLTQLAFLRSLG